MENNFYIFYFIVDIRVRIWALKLTQPFNDQKSYDSPNSFHRSEVILQSCFCRTPNCTLLFKHKRFLNVIIQFLFYLFYFEHRETLNVLIVFCGILSPTENTELENVPC